MSPHTPLTNGSLDQTNGSPMLQYNAGRSAEFAMHLHNKCLAWKSITGVDHIRQSDRSGASTSLGYSDARTSPRRLVSRGICSKHPFTAVGPLDLRTAFHAPVNIQLNDYHSSHFLAHGAAMCCYRSPTVLVSADAAANRIAPQNSNTFTDHTISMILSNKPSNCEQ